VGDHRVDRASAEEAESLSLAEYVRDGELVA